MYNFSRGTSNRLLLPRRHIAPVGHYCKGAICRTLHDDLRLIASQGNMTEVQHVVGSVVEGGAFCRGANSSCNLIETGLENPI